MALDQVFRQTPMKPVLHHKEKCWTYAEADALTDRMAAALIANGIRPGDLALGQTVAAFVSLKPGMHMTEAELRAFAGASVAAYKVPERISFMDEIPKGATGKIFRRGLRELMCDA